MKASMSSKIVTFLALLLIALSFQLSEAQAKDPIPPGSYQRTCRDIIVLGNILQASCKDQDGDWNRSTLYYADCRNIVNDDGRLECNDWKTTKNLPKGSYRRTCSSIDIDGNYLKAKCLDNNRNWRNTSIKYTACNGAIYNSNGKLACSDNITQLPPGNYRSTCKNFDVEGDWVTAWCKDYTGDWKKTSLNFSKCSGNVVNRDGKLRCSQRRRLPEGSYQQSCRAIRIDGDMLKAECRMRNGSYRYTDIKYSYCDRGLVNDNGRLECD